MKNGVGLSNMKALNEALIEEVNNMKQGKMRKCKKD
jgi:hypothetical protein